MTVGPRYAVLLERLSGNPVARQLLWRLVPPDDDGTEFVVTSTTAPYSLVGVETYIFAADITGQITNWSERYGSEQGEDDYRIVLANAGRTVLEDEV